MRIERKSGLRKQGWSAFAVVMVACLLSSPFKTLAQGQGPGARAVRLSNVEGQVQLSMGNQILAQQAPVNAPLFEGTQISTSDDGRAEVQFEDGSVARISPNSSMTLSVLRQQGESTDTEVLMQSGLGYFELQGDNSVDQMRVRFGNNAASASGFTVFRIDLDNPPGEMAVFSGNAHLDNGSTMSVDMHGGETVRLNSADPTNWALLESIEPDSWDAWNSDRDQALTAQEAARTAATSSLPNSSNPAWSDLDANGDWYNVPGQGYVWSPYEAQNSGWDPYGWGSWLWTPGLGYGWVSGEPWGFMPYAMGMWDFYPGFGWGWMPGGGGGWWGNGGWASNVGNGPQRYQPPVKPRGGPVLPVHGAPMMQGKYEAHPVISVNRLVSNPTDNAPRVRNAPRVIAGNTLQPLRPLAPRPSYQNGFASGQNRQMAPLSRPGTGVHYGYTGNPYGNAGARQGNWGGGTGSRQLGSSGRATGAAGSAGGGSFHGSGSSHGSTGGGGSHGGGGGGSHGGGSGGGGGGGHR